MWEKKLKKHEYALIENFQSDVFNFLNFSNCQNEVS